jgi:hypothetical protein
LELCERKRHEVRVGSNFVRRRLRSGTKKAIGSQAGALSGMPTQQSEPANSADFSGWDDRISMAQRKTAPDCSGAVAESV